MTAPPQAEIIQLNVGDTVPLGSLVVNLILMGIVTDINNPNMFAATMEAFQQTAALTVPVLQGPPGNDGQPAFALQWQNDGKTDPTELPTSLGDTVADLGKFWVFGIKDTNGNTVATTMYIWWGSVIGWRQLPVGAPGPPGPYPVITPHIVREATGSGNGPGGVDSWIAVTGPASNPQMTFHIAAPQGPVGPAASLGEAADVDFTTRAPQPGDTLQCTARKTPGAPTNLTITMSSTGGSLVGGPYFYKVLATVTNGKTLAGNEVTSGALTGTTSKATLNWLAPANGGATGYEVWRGTGIGSENRLMAVITDPTVTTWIDNGTQAGTPGTMPSVGIVAGRSIWVPTPLKIPTINFYTIPEAAFSSVLAIGGATQPICTYEIPVQDGACKPWVTGQLQIHGANISLTPLLVGAEVRLGDPNTGPVVARGFGNSLGYVTFIPHPSTPSTPADAMTPTNAYGKIPLGATAAQRTLYVNLVNQGMAGVYDFNSGNAQMDVVLWPVAA